MFDIALALVAIALSVFAIFSIRQKKEKKKEVKPLDQRIAEHYHTFERHSLVKCTLCEFATDFHSLRDIRKTMIEQHGLCISANYFDGSSFYISSIDRENKDRAIRTIRILTHGSNIGDIFIFFPAPITFDELSAELDRHKIWLISLQRNYEIDNHYVVKTRAQ